MKIRAVLGAGIGTMALVIIVLLTVLWPRRQNDESGQEEPVREITVISSYEVPAHQEALKKIAENYEAQQDGISVVIEFVSKESFREEVCLRVEREEDIDLVICDRMMMPALIDMNLLQEINITEPVRNRMNYQKMWASTLSNGRYYGVPLTCDPYVLFYRRDILESWEVPETWEELLDTGTGLRQMGRYSMGFPAKRTEEAAEFFLLMLYSMGGNLYSLDGDAGLGAMDTISEMWNRGLLPDNIINLSDKDLAGMFSNGNLTMMVNRLSMGKVIRNAGTTLDVGIAQVPEDTAGSRFIMGDNVGLAKDAVPEALEFLRYLCTPEISVQLAETMGTYPVYTNADYEPEATSWCGTQSLEPLFLAENRMIEPHGSWYQISREISDGLLLLLEGNTDSSSVAEQMQDQIRVAIMEE